MTELTQMSTDVLIVGGGLSGVAAALAAVEGGASVVLVEGDRWLGGQLTAQAVPPDEHVWEPGRSGSSHPCDRPASEVFKPVGGGNQALQGSSRQLKPHGGGYELCWDPS